MEWPMQLSHPYVRFWVVMFTLIFLGWLWSDALARHRVEVTAVMVVILIIFLFVLGR